MQIFAIATFSLIIALWTQVTLRKETDEPTEVDQLSEDRLLLVITKPMERNQ